MNNTRTSKPITKYVTLKVTYNSFYIDGPETWDWNEIVDVCPGENIEVVRSSDFPPRNEF